MSRKVESAMSSEQDRARQIATRIARRVSRDAGDAATEPDADAGDVGEELAAVRETLSELQAKLARIESHLTQEEDRPLQKAHGADQESRAETSRQEDASTRPPTFAHSPWLSGVYVPAAHPSQERFGVDEATLSELVDYFEKEKTCSLEPGGKPCDHCAMCSTRGF
jgi:hypothetical protein